MSREIKWRFWNSEEMVTPDENEGVFDKRYLLSQHGDLMIHDRANDSMGSVSHPVMQFTGLLDKNGVEIYEGDIVQCESPFHSCVLEVKYGWHENGVGKEVDGFYLFLADQFEWEIYKSDIDRHDYTVIGNIYEHSHLLETK